MLLSAGYDFGVALGFLIFTSIYMAPTIVAVVRKHQVASVAVVNFFFGWTLIGWVVALVMAVRDRPAASKSAVPAPDAAASPYRYCTSCGARNSFDAAYCSACGSPMGPKAVDEPTA